MRKLGEQWVEEIDGVKHMLKAVEPFELCQGCCFNCNQGGCCWKGFDDCQMGSFFIIKDLGILNDDGCLPSSWGEYPTIEAPSCLPDLWCVWAFLSKDGQVSKQEMAWGDMEQQAIDAWNRRA